VPIYNNRRDYSHTIAMLTIRAATIADAALLRRLIWELADFEKAPDDVQTTEADIARDGFGSDPQFHALIAEWAGQPAGFALFFSYYSTWRGAGLHLEDLFVCPEFRGRGIGTALFARVARTAARENRGFIKLQVLDWNQPAIAMYRGLGGELLDDWREVLITGDGLRKLAERDPTEHDSTEKGS
jgi:GNAT superfamily N-acetyltransferase